MAADSCAASSPIPGPPHRIVIGRARAETKEAKDRLRISLHTPPASQRAPLYPPVSSLALFLLSTDTCSYPPSLALSISHSLFSFSVFHHPLLCFRSLFQSLYLSFSQHRMDCLILSVSLSWGLNLLLIFRTIEYKRCKFKICLCISNFSLVLSVNFR